MGAPVTSSWAYVPEEPCQELITWRMTGTGNKNLHTYHCQHLRSSKRAFSEFEVLQKPISFIRSIIICWEFPSEMVENLHFNNFNVEENEWNEVDRKKLMGSITPIATPLPPPPPPAPLFSAFLYFPILFLGYFDFFWGESRWFRWLTKTDLRLLEKPQTCIAPLPPPLNHSRFLAA